MKIRKKIYGTVFAILCLGIIPTFTNAFNWNTIYVGDTETTVNDYTQRPTANGNYNFVGDNTNGNFFRYGNGSKTVFFYYTDEGMAVYTNTYVGLCKEGIINKYYIDTYTGFTNFTREGVKNSSNNIMTYTQSDIYNLGLQKGDFNALSYSTEEGISNFGNYGIVAICWRSLTKDISVCTYASADGYGTAQCTPNSNTIKNQWNEGINITTPSQIPTNYLKNAKRENNNSRDDSTSGGQGIPVVNVSCPTIQQLINSYQEQYQPGLCYSSEKIWSGNGFVSLTPKTIFELYPYYTGFEQDINTYYNYCNNSISTATTCQQAFAGKEEEYTLISKIPNNVNDVKLYQYCNLELNYENKNVTVCVDSGAGTNPTIPIENIIDEIVRKPRQITLPGNTEQNGSGNITGDNIFSDIVNGEDIEGIGDVINSLQSVYNKLTGLFYRRSGVDGIIPDIIVRILLLIILFKIFKK